jgi:hypothetical protein
MINKTFLASVYITGTILLMEYVNQKDKILFVLLFVITQLFAGITAVILILLRFFRFVRNRNSFFYSLTGSILLALLITDSLLLFDHTLVKRTILVFAGLNALMGIIILADVYKGNKRRINELRV